MKIDINKDNADVLYDYPYEMWFSSIADCGPENIEHFCSVLDSIINDEAEIMVRPAITPELIEELFGEVARDYFIAKKKLKEKK